MKNVKVGDRVAFVYGTARERKSGTAPTVTGEVVAVFAKSVRVRTEERGVVTGVSDFEVV